MFVKIKYIEKYITFNKTKSYLRIIKCHLNHQITEQVFIPHLVEWTSTPSADIYTTITFSKQLSSLHQQALTFTFNFHLMEIS